MYLVECKPDEIVVDFLTLATRENVRHAGNKSELLKTLTTRYENSKGIVDEDPGRIQPPQLQKFQEQQDLTTYNLRILHQASRNNTLIILCPTLEEWILKAAREANVDPKEYSLPDEPIRLRHQINFLLDKLQRLLDELRTKSNRLRELKKYLTTGI